jgi:hypothetical protein
MTPAERHHHNKRQEEIERSQGREQFFLFTKLMRFQPVSKCSAGAYYKQV